jgi:hypothetical protein
MANNYYNHTTYPIAGSQGSSALLRGELDAIMAGFDKMPVLTGNGGKFVTINATGTGMVVSSALTESGGNLTCTSATMTWSGNPTHSGNHTFQGAVTFQGAMTLSASALASPPPIGSVTPNTGAFTSLSAQSVTASVGGFVFPDATVQTTAAGSGAFTAYQALSTLAYLGY